MPQDACDYQDMWFKGHVCSIQIIQLCYTCRIMVWDKQDIQHRRPDRLYGTIQDRDTENKVHGICDSEDIDFAWYLAG